MERTLEQRIMNMPSWDDVMPIIRETYPSIADDLLDDYGIVYNEIVEALEVWMDRHGVCCICRQRTGATGERDTF